MSIAKLKNIIAPPAEPVDAGEPPDWAAIEQHLGICLPPDYKEYIHEYGTGSVGDFIWVFNPFTTNRHLRLEDQIRTRLDAVKRLESTFGQESPFPLFPKNPGLLPLGATDNGDCLYWLTEGAPQSWPIVVVDSRAPDWERFNLSLTDFIAAIITRERVCGIFPDSFPPTAARFVPVA
jgi:hypothetical protein